MLTAAGWPVLVSVATPYGATLAREGFAGPVVVGRRDAAALAVLIGEQGVRLVVDATHPFATEAHRNARQAAAKCGVPYLRYARPQAPLPADPRVIACADFTTAAQEAVARGPVLFLTTGSKTLPLFLPVARAAGCRVVARVLPEPAVIAACREAGLSPRDIVALQGPLPVELNAALFHAFGATVVVTKESGAVGGQDAKMEAALNLGIPVVVVRRPPEPPEAVFTAEELLKRVTEILGRGTNR
jgi:precorrin-6A/cobalt-precorrin-6A reductase